MESVSGREGRPLTARWSPSRACVSHLSEVLSCSVLAMLKVWRTRCGWVGADNNIAFPARNFWVDA